MTDQEKLAELQVLIGRNLEIFEHSYKNRYHKDSCQHKSTFYCGCSCRLDLVNLSTGVLRTAQAALDGEPLSEDAKW